MAQQLKKVKSANQRSVTTMRTLQLHPKNFFATLLILVTGLLYSARISAQDKDIDIHINTDADNVAWYNLWWVWVIGTALFIIILVAIVSARRKT